MIGRETNLIGLLLNGATYIFSPVILTLTLVIRTFGSKKNDKVKIPVLITTKLIACAIVPPSH